MTGYIESLAFISLQKSLRTYTRKVRAQEHAKRTFHLKETIRESMSELWLDIAPNGYRAHRS